MTKNKTSVFSLNDSAALAQYLALCGRFRSFDRREAMRVAEACVRYYKGDADARRFLRSGQVMETRWYDSLAAGKPDYGVYDDEYYISDIWSCWVVYSRRYLLDIQKPTSFDGRVSIATDVRPVRSVIDLGCGFGYTTAGLKEIFPECAVYGTNLPGTLQFAVAEEIGKARGFTLVTEAGEVGGPVDLVFASEYFEHIEDPIRHVREVVRACSPKALIVANAFGSKSIGHFDAYLADGACVDNKSIGRVFNAELRSHGYELVKTRMWNNRPAYWRRSK